MKKSQTEMRELLIGLKFGKAEIVDVTHTFRYGSHEWIVSVGDHETRDLSTVKFQSKHQVLRWVLNWLQTLTGADEER